MSSPRLVLVRCYLTITIERVDIDMSKDKNKDESGADSVEDSFIVNVPLKFQSFHIPEVLRSIPTGTHNTGFLAARDALPIELGRLSDVMLEGLCAKFRDGVFTMAARQRKDEDS